METIETTLINPFTGYKPPFEFDGYGYIYTDEGSMALNRSDYENNSGALSKRIEGILNKKRDDYFDTIGVREDDPCALLIGGEWYIIRGWGHLTGCGAMNLE